MWFLGFGKKVDPKIKAYMKINLKRKIPVIVCFKDNIKLVKSKLLYAGGKIKHEYIHVNAISCELSPYSVDKLSEIPEISYVSIDHKASLCLKNSHDAMGINHAKVFNLTGKNVGIGLVDSGVFPHPDLVSKRSCISYFSDLINGVEKSYDDNGHGTFMAGCIASSGSLSSNMYSGIAPDSNLCVVKAFDAAGNGFMSDIIKAIDMLMELKDRYNIRIICLPFEFQYMNKIKVNPLEEIIKKAISLNIAVVVPSGNLGPQPYSIYFPGNMKEAITVGGCSCIDSSSKAYKMSSFSGRGPTSEGLSKPDIIAPSVNITSLAANTSFVPSFRLKPELRNQYTTMSGTSAACALVCGVCALILEKTPELTPADLKSMLSLSTMSIGENKLSQGNGLMIFEKIAK
jgi:hypothetical protein